MKLVFLFALFVSLNFSITACSDGSIETGEIEESLGNPRLPVEENNPPPDRDEEQAPACVQSLHFDQWQPNFFQKGCKKPSRDQMNQVSKGNLKKEKFLSQCYQATKDSCWCDQLIRPNPNSLSTFQCTYGNEQVHQLIHPDESTWKYAFEAVKIVEEFQAKNMATEIIYNWWRPEPYNDNVGGSPTRHPYGTSVDVRFKTKPIQEKAFLELCKMRRKGRVRAIGYYASTALHLGVGDHRANTWGKACP